METEAAFSSSANSFILEKVLQEVKEVENRERHEEKEETSDSDLKFRPGFVHILKDRFALLSIKSDNGDDDEGPLKSTSIYDISESSNLGNSRGLSKSSDQLDGRFVSRHRGSLQSPSSPERHVNRINGSIATSPTVTSRAFVKLNSKESVESVGDVPIKSHPPSIHLFSRSTDSKTLDHIRSAGNKVIIIESAPKTSQDNNVNKTATLTKQSSIDKTHGTASSENKSNEAWPVPNIVSSTRSLFEQSGKKRPAPPAPVAQNSESGFKSPQSPSSPVRNISTPVTPPTQILVHGQPIKVLQTTPKSPSFDRRAKPPAPAPRRPQPQKDERESPTKPTGVLPSSSVENAMKDHQTDECVKEEAVVTVSEARLMFDKDTPVAKTSPKKSRNLVFPASNTTVDSTKNIPTKKSSAPPPPLASKSNSAGPSSPKRQPLFKAASLPSVVPKPVNTLNSPTEPSKQKTDRPSPIQSTSRDDSSTWQTWDDIPKPKRRTFVSEARRVDISKEQLSESRSRNKSFFFTVNEPTRKLQKLENEDPNDKTIKISVPKSPELDLVNSSLSKTKSESRLAQETFWASYRDEDGKTLGVDPELLGDYQRLMASVREGGSIDSESIDQELEELPSTNIDDIMNDIQYARQVTESKPRTVGIRVIVKDKNKVKPKISFANGGDLISTYEYLSERAMIEELGISPDFDMNGGELSIDDPASLFGLDDDDDEEALKKTAKALPGTSAVTAGSLASYKPKYGGDDYNWGQESETTSSVSTSRDVLDGDHLTKADSQATAENSEREEMNWSSAATADLLF